MLRVIGFSLAAISISAGLANAGSDFTTIRRDVPVAYGDLNLATEAGARTMLTRITNAAREACGGSPFFYGDYSMTPGLARKDFAACQTNAVNTAVKSLNAPQVMRVYAQNGDEALRLAGR